MPQIIDPETIAVDDLPTIWSPVQWDLTEEERIQELESQSAASMLWSADVPEAILRLLLSETDIVRTFDPPAGYDPEVQGEWDANLVTFRFRRPIELIKSERSPDCLYVEYRFGELGYWGIEIKNDEVHIRRL